MISKKTRTEEWIRSARVDKTSPSLTEKMIMAFSLAEALQMAGLKYVFKGGTSVSLITQELRRFSVDIDIVVPPETKIEPHLDLIKKQGVFTNYKEDKREGHLPGTHYQVEYPSIVPTKYLTSVLIDVLYADNFYADVREVPLVSSLLDQEGDPCLLLCPTIDCLLGDKLTAIAPHTTGIMIDSKRTLGVLKQFYDVATLYDISRKPTDLFKTFENVSQFELEIRELSSQSTNDVANDILDTAIMICSRGELGNKEEFAKMTSQIVPLRSYIFRGAVSQDALILWAAKAATLAAAYLSGKRDLIRYEGQDVRQMRIEDPGPSQLNKIIKTSAESFFYIRKALELVGRA
jgi:Nucleotidyl transferase AbiEii toxin, Type IV TA system